MALGGTMGGGVKRGLTSYFHGDIEGMINYSLSGMHHGSLNFCSTFRNSQCGHLSWFT